MAEKAANFGPDIMRMAEKSLLLQLLDQDWKDHLLTLDHLRQGIGLRAYGQRDPFNEYSREAFEMFQAMLGRLREQVTALLSHVEIRRAEPEQAVPPPHRRRRCASRGAIRRWPRRRRRLRRRDGPRPMASTMVRRTQTTFDQPIPRPGPARRATPLSCGSGKKYKHCHGKV